MRAFVIDGPRSGRVAEVDPPTPGPGQVVVDVTRVGLCGTDVELFAGTMVYLQSGDQRAPMVPGHEWVGRVAQIGPGVTTVEPGRRVTGDTMLGCLRCDRCRNGRHHVCDDRFEIGIRGNWPGALAEQLLVPATALRELPGSVDDAAAALVEPGGCAWRAVEAAGVGPGNTACVYGPGTLGLLTLHFLVARGVAVDVVGLDATSLELATMMGANAVHRAGSQPNTRYDAVIDTSTGADVPGTALRHVTPSGRLVLVGVAETPSVVDLRQVVIGDIKVIGILAASAGLDATIREFSTRQIPTDLLVGATVALDQVADVLAGKRPAHAGPGPKIQVDPRQGDQ
ncbi:alcohol dehydrogenase catalytic domain-containing protein [Actinoplanes sp. NPDC026619]|uniref:zinc-dependent alcohol dehydrogenase n=1 Tax=Actinoplanes sp. NPDC026619 TaxID=3155798 RepID=UPI0033D36577